uniref:Uncharacterized protein n=1 Tax=Arundo donax TaxID=35708 RepID=A0A0A8YPS3_ARUDO
MFISQVTTNTADSLAWSVILDTNNH